MKQNYTGFKLLILLALAGIFNSKNGFSQTGGWQLLPNSPSVPDRFDDIYFINDSTGWAVNSQGKIYRTLDAGNSWQLQLQVIGYFRSVEFLNADTGFAGTLDSKLFKTVNGGEDWYNIIDSLPVQVDGICGMSHIDNTIYACGIYSSPGYLLKSEDAGKTWTYTDMSGFADALVDCYFFSKDTGFVSGADNTAASKGVILKTFDGGVTWQVKKKTDNMSYVWKMDFISKLHGYASIQQSDSSIVLKTIDGGESWQQLVVTTGSIAMQGVGFLNDTLGWCGGWSNGMWETKDGGNSWSYVSIGSNFNRYFKVNDGKMYGAGKGIFVYDAEGFPTTVSNTQLDNPLPHTLFPVYPNPFSKKATIRIELDQSTRVRLELFNAQGMRVWDIKPGYLAQGLHEFDLNGSSLSQGNYFLVMKTNERALNREVIVVK